jgi:transposase
MKKNYYPEKVAAVKRLLSGESFNSVSKDTGIKHCNLKLLLSKYQKHGELSLLDSKSYPQHTFEAKKDIIEDIENNHLTLLEASLKYDIYLITIKRWLKSYYINGLEAFQDKRIMKHKKKRVYNKKELDELSELRKRNEYLEAENALLKKVKALVEAREVQLREIGRKPFKG